MSNTCRLLGDTSRTQFRACKEGGNDYLEGRVTTHQLIIRDGRVVQEIPEIVSKLYIHISNTWWSTFTGILRQCLLPWRWKTAYLARENGLPPERILVCTSLNKGELAMNIRKALNRSLFITNLIQAGNYQEIYGHEFLTMPRADNRVDCKKMAGFLGNRVEIHDANDYCPIYRIRGIFSFFMYHLLSMCSPHWEKTVVQVNGISERMLTQKRDHQFVFRN